MRDSGDVLAGSRIKGFTLLEVLLALSIFALIGAGSFQLISSSVNAQQRSEQRMLYLRSVDRLFGSMERDLLQAVERPVRDGYGDSLKAFIGDRESIEFTHGGWANRPAAIASNSGRPAHANLKRSAYRFELLDHGGGYQGRWSSYFWDVLDRVPSSESQSGLVLDGVERVTLRYQSHGKNWSNYWPVTVQDNPSEYGELPLAIEVEFVLVDFGRVRRLFQVSSSVLLNNGEAAL